MESGACGVLGILAQRVAVEATEGGGGPVIIHPPPMGETYAQDRHTVMLLVTLRTAPEQSMEVGLPGEAMAHVLKLVELAVVLGADPVQILPLRMEEETAREDQCPPSLAKSCHVPVPRMGAGLSGAHGELAL